jgi:hypothetical protein
MAYIFILFQIYHTIDCMISRKLRRVEGVTYENRLYALYFNAAGQLKKLLGGMNCEKTVTSCPIKRTEPNIGRNAAGNEYVQVPQ